jgi:TPP-dependent pyruvate/acetoin dehydrogenase alpha subunit
MPGVIVDGNDIFAVYEAARDAMDRARSGGGPTLIECKTYRFRPHSNADNDLKYRTQEEIDSWHERDPIRRLEEYLLGHNLITHQEIDAFSESIRDEVDQATRAVEQAADPPLDSLHQHLYG